MSEVTDTPATPAQEVASNYTPKSFDIAPEDQSIADSIRAIDPVFDVAGSAETDVALKFPGEVPLDWLSPGQRSKVAERMASAPGTSEQEAIRAELYDNAYMHRVLAGPGPNANAYQVEGFALERDIHEAKQELWQVELELAKVDRWDNSYDEKTGSSTPVVVHALTGQRRTATEHRRNELRHRLTLLEGGEGEGRMKRALHQAVQEQKRRAAEVEIDAAAQKRAQQIVRDEAVEDRARAYAKFVRTER